MFPFFPRRPELSEINRSLDTQQAHTSSPRNRLRTATAQLLQHRPPCFSCRCISLAVRSVIAASVSVGLAVAPVANTLDPAMKRFSWSWQRPVAVHHGILGVLAHDAGAHDVCGGVPVEVAVRLQADHGLRQRPPSSIRRSPSTLQIRPSTRPSSTRRPERDQRSRQLQRVVQLVRHLDAIVRAREHLRRETQADHAA